MLIAFLSKRLRLWLFLALGAPVLAWVLGFVGDRLESRNGPTRVTRALGKARGWLTRRTKGILISAQSLTAEATDRTPGFE